MSYRDELAAAQNRSSALERELGEMRRQLLAVEGARSSAWSRLMERGEDEQTRFHRAARRDAHQAAVAKKRGMVRDAQYKRFGEHRRSLRSMTRWGMFAHWFFPTVSIGPLVFFLPLFILFETARSILFVYLAGIALVYGVSNVFGLFLADREEARLEVLPFVVRGHQEAIAAENPNLIASMKFVDDAPSRSQMATWILGVAAETPGMFRSALVRNTKVEKQGGNIVLRPTDAVTGWLRGNRSYLCWYRRVVERAAVELHGSFPIESIRIGSA